MNKQKHSKAYESHTKIRNINSARDPKHQNNKNSQRKSIKQSHPKSNKKRIQDRLDNIRKGFKELQKNWNLTDKKKLTVSHQDQKNIEKIEKLSTHKKNSSSYGLQTRQKKDFQCHQCIYEKSLHNLIGIIEHQKIQIQSLKSQLIQSKMNNTLSSKKSSQRKKRRDITQ